MSTKLSSNAAKGVDSGEGAVAGGVTEAGSGAGSPVPMGASTGAERSAGEVGEGGWLRQGNVKRLRWSEKIVIEGLSAGVGCLVYLTERRKSGEEACVAIGDGNRTIGGNVGEAGRWRGSGWQNERCD